MITIHYNFTDGTEVSYAEGKELVDGFTTCCLDFFVAGFHVKVVRKDGSYIYAVDMLLNDGRYGQKEFRLAHNFQRLLKAGAITWQKASVNNLIHDYKRLKEAANKNGKCSSNDDVLRCYGAITPNDRHERRA